MKVEDIIRENAEKQKLLSKENEKVYGDILLYIRSSAVDEKWSEETLLEILDHLIEAQNQGRSAREIIGHDSKAYCDELLAVLPKDRWRQKLSYASFLLIPLALYLIPNALIGEMSLSIFNGLLAPLFFGLTIFSFFWALKREVYSARKFVYYLLPIVCFFLAIVMTGLHELFDVKTFLLDERLSVIIGIVLLIIVTVFYVRWKFWDILFYLAVLIAIVTCAELGYLNQFAAIILLISLLFLQPVVSLWILKRKQT